MALIALFCYNRGRGNVTWPQQGCHNRAVTKATRIRGCASAPAPSRHTRLPMWPPSALQTGRWGHHAGSPGRPFTPPSGAGPSHRARMDLPHNKPDALQTRCTTNRANNKPGGQKKGTPDRQNRCAQWWQPGGGCLSSSSTGALALGQSTSPLVKRMLLPQAGPCPPQTPRDNP